MLVSVATTVICNFWKYPTERYIKKKSGKLKITYFWIMFSKPKSIFLSTIILLDYFFFLFSSTKRVVIAICGVGRAGTIHLFNALHNHLIKVKYLVDLDVKKVMEMKKEYFLEEIIVLHADEFDKVLSIYAKNRNFSKVSSRVTRTIFSFYC